MGRLVAVLLPTLWDEKQLATCRGAWGAHYDVRLLGPADADVHARFDVRAFVREIAEQHPTLVGATSSSDYPGAVAAALLAERLARPGAAPRAVLACGHKGEARALEARVVPEAVPWWRLLEAGAQRTLPDGLRYPCFVKPARGSFSVLARQVDAEAALVAYLTHPETLAHTDEYVGIHRRLARDLGHGGPDAGCFVAEGLLTGLQATLEGWLDQDGVHVLGIVDSVMHPGTRAFARFETPSALPPRVQARMADIARRVVPALGLAQTCFNVELAWDAATDVIGLIEVNPRLAGQFGDLWQKTLGRNGYEIALALAAGDAPPRPSTGPFAFAASVPLRTFAPTQVERAPSSEQIAAVEAASPGTHVWWECAPGDVLSHFDAAGEGQGWRYAVVNLGARTRAELETKARAVVEDLGARLTALG